jgi:hypothetical protein
MRSRFDESNESAYAYYGGFLNAGYITGFARRTEGKNFVVQQTNDPQLSLPVDVEDKKLSSPQDTMPVKVIGRFVGERLESGERVVHFKTITLDRPSIRELPNRLAWEKPIFGAQPVDKFKPFFDPKDDEEVISSIFYKGEKRNGRPCLNVARIAGFIESFAYKQASPGERDDCLYIALRQTANPDESLPIRVYGRFADAFRKQIQVALPIFIEGFYRVKRENKGTAEAPIMVLTPYIHCSNIKVATPSDIKVRPAWWVEMKDRLIKTTKDRVAIAQAKKSQAPAQPASAAKPRPAIASEQSSLKVEIPSAPVIPTLDTL